MAQARQHRPRPRPIVVLATVLLSVFAGGRIVAAEAGRPALQRDARPAAEPRGAHMRLLRDGRLMPRVSFQLESISAMNQATEQTCMNRSDSVFHGSMTASVQRSFERATRRAVRDYLIEAADLDARIELIRPRRSRARAVESLAAPSTPSRERMRVDLSVSHFMPEVEMRYRMGRGALKFSVDAEGAFGMRYRDARLDKAEIRAGFDGDDRYHLLCRFGF